MEYNCIKYIKRELINIIVCKLLLISSYIPI